MLSHATVPSPFTVIPSHPQCKTPLRCQSGVPMGYKHISDDLKEAAVRLKERGQDTDLEISQITGFSTRTLYRVLRRKAATGSVANPPAISRGRPRTLIEARLQLSFAACTTQTNALPG